MSFKEVKKIYIEYGTSLEEAFTEAKGFAKENDCWVEFDFNGVRLSMSKYADVSDQLRYYENKFNDLIQR